MSTLECGEYPADALGCRREYCDSVSPLQPRVDVESRCGEQS